MQGKKILIALTTAIGIGVLALPVMAKPGPSTARGAGNILAQLDTNGDGVISLEEFVDARIARAEAGFDIRDENGDGLITEDEVGRDRPEPPDGFDPAAFRACVEDQLGVELPEPPEPGSRFAEADLNGDGAIDLGEAISNATDNATERFLNLDDNADGVLDADELATIRARHRALREARRTCREQSADVAAVLGS